jgi:hypothetical protein
MQRSPASMILIMSFSKNASAYIPATKLPAVQAIAVVHQPPELLTQLDRHVGMPGAISPA